MQKVKVIFLDIDGVVATERALNEKLEEWYGVTSKPMSEMNKIRKDKLKRQAYVPNYNMSYWPFDPIAVSYLHRIVRDNEDVKFVISSSWRESTNMKMLEHVFRLKGLHIPMIGFTRLLDNGDADRGLEIVDWINTDHGYEVTHWCAIDDMDITIRRHIGDKLVHTNELIGIEYEEYQQICKLLDLRQSYNA